MMDISILFACGLYVAYELAISLKEKGDSDNEIGVANNDYIYPTTIKLLGYYT